MLCLWNWVCIWATAFIYFDEKKMWRQAGFEEMLVSPAKRDPNEMGGLQKRDRFWCASYLWTYWCQRLENETNHGGVVPKPEKRDLKKSVGGLLIHLLYVGATKTNKRIPPLNMLCSQLLFVSWCVNAFCFLPWIPGVVLCLAYRDGGMGLDRGEVVTGCFVLMKLGVTGSHANFQYTTI